MQGSGKCAMGQGRALLQEEDYNYSSTIDLLRQITYLINGIDKSLTWDTFRLAGFPLWY